MSHRDSLTRKSRRDGAIHPHKTTAVVGIPPHRLLENWVVMFMNLIEKLQIAFGINRKNGAACTAVHEYQTIENVKYHDLDHLSGSWVADEEFDTSVKAFDLIDRPRIS